MLTVLEKVDLIQKASIFKEIPTESLVRIAAIAQEVNFEPSQWLFLENEAAASLFVLLEGQVLLLRKGKEEKTLGVFEFPGAFPVLADAHHPASAQATQPTRALRIDQPDLFEAMTEDFNVTRGILKALVGLAAGGH